MHCLTRPSFPQAHCVNCTRGGCSDTGSISLARPSSNTPLSRNPPCRDLRARRPAPPRIAAAGRSVPARCGSRAGRRRVSGAAAGRDRDAGRGLGRVMERVGVDLADGVTLRVGPTWCQIQRWAWDGWGGGGGGVRQGGESLLVTAAAGATVVYARRGGRRRGAAGWL
jgi:hypothetical protein